MLRNRVKEMRKELKMTQASLCKKAGISRTTLDKIENGDTVNIKTSTITKIAYALNSPADKVFYF